MKEFYYFGMWVGVSTAYLLDTWLGLLFLFASAMALIIDRLDKG